MTKLRGYRMKVIILLITVSILFSCGKRITGRRTKTNAPIFSTPRIPPSYRLTHTCNRSKSSTKTVWNCYDNSSLYKMCVITYRAGFSTWKCNTWLFEMDSELDSFQCSKASGGGFNTMDCYKQSEGCILKYGRLLSERCYIRSE